MEEGKTEEKEKNKGREKNTKRGRPNGGKHLREKTHGKRVVSTQREVPRKRKDQNGEQPTAR